MSLNRFIVFELFFWINLIYLSYCLIDEDVSWEKTDFNKVEGSGDETDLIPVNIKNIISRSDLQLNSMALNSNQLKTISSLISANMEILKEEIKLMIKTEINNSDKKSFDVHEIKCSDNRFPENCYEVNECHSNVYSILLPNYSDTPFPASCDLKTSNGGWTVIQRRQDGLENFYKNWTDYVEGFGNMDGEFFIGLEKLHVLTTQGKPQELYIILEDFEGTRKYANYKTFEVESESTEYKLKVEEYSGNAGDSLSYHNESTFSTKDQGEKKYCASNFKGGWWYGDCHESNLNGLYLNGKMPKSKRGEGVSWGEFRGYDYSLKFVQMMIRPKDQDD